MGMKNNFQTWGYTWNKKSYQYDISIKSYARKRQVKAENILRGVVVPSTVSFRTSGNNGFNGYNGSIA